MSYASLLFAFAAALSSAARAEPGVLPSSAVVGAEGWLPGVTEVLQPAVVRGPAGAVRVVVPVGPLLDEPDVYDLVLEQVVGLAAVREGAPVWLDGLDGRLVPLASLRPEVPPAPPKERAALAIAPVTHPTRGDGALSGRAVYVSQCHGWQYYTSLSRFSSQRPVLFNTVEDFHNPEGANEFLIPMLENAGAAVFTARERDSNPLSVIVDNGESGYAESGSGFENGAPGWATLATLPYGTNPFDAGTTRRFPAAGGAVATWTPDVPADGEYAVYVSWDSDPTHASDAHYRLTHPGGVIDRFFDQRVHGSTWQYVDTLYLTAGKSLSIELIADSAEAGRSLSADAVRVGGGMANVSRAGKLPASGSFSAARWEEAALSYVQFNGAPPSVYDAQGNGIGTDHVARSMWAAWEHPQGEDAVYLSWHSNAASGTARGTVTYFAGGGPDAPASKPSECSRGAVSGSYTLANLVQQEIVAGVRALHETDWLDRGVATACFSEVSSTLNPEFPSILVELAFHDNAADTAWLKDPRFRHTSARAMYRGIVRYFAERDGVPPRYLPEPPEELALVHGGDGKLRLSWAPGPVGAPYGDAPTGYVVETSPDGKVWTRTFTTSSTSTVLGAAPGAVRYVRVLATNAGGVSFPSEVLGARRDGSGAAPLLIVSGYDRLDAFQLPFRDAGAIGDVVTMDLPRMNPFDTAVAHGQAAAAAGWTFDTVSDEAFLDLDLSAYAAIWWVAGEESSGTTTLTPGAQARVRDFVGAGGGFWVSGSELLWDLDARGDAADKAFCDDVLSARLASDKADSEAVSGEGLLAGVGAMDFSAAAGGAYPVDFPDSLDSAAPVVARYGDGSVAGVLASRVAVFGFPFETIGDPAVRTEVAARLLGAIAPDVTPGQPVGPGDTGSDSGRPDGVDDPGAGGGLDAARVPRGALGGCGCAWAAAWPQPASAGWPLLLVVGLGWTRRRRRVLDGGEVP
jgi:MYXO-CTERM domain-containing protein